MKKLALFLMKYNLKRAKLKQENETNSIVRYAYGYLIESYESTIMFLEAEIKSDKKK